MATWFAKATLVELYLTRTGEAPDGCGARSLPPPFPSLFSRRAASSSCASPWSHSRKHGRTVTTAQRLNIHTHVRVQQVCTHTHTHTLSRGRTVDSRLTVAPCMLFPPLDKLSLHRACDAPFQTPLVYTDLRLIERIKQAYDDNDDHLPEDVETQIYSEEDKKLIHDVIAERRDLTSCVGAAVIKMLVAIERGSS